jgi:hypothetical protein
VPSVEFVYGAVQIPEINDQENHANQNKRRKQDCHQAGSQNNQAADFTEVETV